MKDNQDHLFGRTVVGYDLRKPELLGNVYMASNDEEARYEAVYDLYASYLSGLNLFNVDPSQIPSFPMPQNGKVIAFDLPTKYVEVASTGSVSVPPILAWFEPLKNWNFLGFDVVDPRTQLSVLKMVLDEEVSRGGGVNNLISTNKFSLLDSIECAERAISIFETKYFEHAPLVPCGVWFKEQQATGIGQTSALM